MLPVEEEMALPRVGITQFRLPVKVHHQRGEVQTHDASANMNVSLAADKNGVSMSRLCSILQQQAEEYEVNRAFFEQTLTRYRKELTDPSDKEPIDRAFLRLNFDFPVKQRSLKSDNWGWQYYPVSFAAELTEEKGLRYFLQLEYLYSSTCPCSLSMAKQYEKDFETGKTDEGSGIGVPHSQRSKLRCKIEMGQDELRVEELVQLIRQAIPTETQSLVKRLDEQAFAILNGAHPMFVEHASKRLAQVLNGEKRILDWLFSVEHLESLHSHNAAAVTYKGIKGGFRADTIF